MDGYAAAGDLLKVCGHPVRLQILEVLLRDGEACVCHLESHLGQRQAAISQHLARLRQAGLVVDRRDGWNIFYSVTDPSIQRVVTAARRTASQVAQLGGDRLAFDLAGRREANTCPCPRCEKPDPGRASRKQSRPSARAE
ncbi:MAG TPA: metalloregulator ArsR/SmtB family transcription factor [Anaerolineales bacterium]|nr:metalloregulator ArsR/SmtB family transcription factor [Anaerolineales bacterium]